jgi:cytochrome c peroxidase
MAGARKRLGVLANPLGGIFMSRFGFFGSRFFGSRFSRCSRFYSTEPKKRETYWREAVACVIGLAGAYYLDNSRLDYQKVYNTIAQKLEADYDDGSYGPVLVRLAWHASGTFDLKSKTGGSNGATMRFHPESQHEANAGLSVARDFLEPIKKQFPSISYADLWSLAGVCAIQEMGGPVIPWRAGRKDLDATSCTPDGRLPDASKTQDHLRDVFHRMGFTDKDIVALSGAHVLGRCHPDRSGFDGIFNN